MKYLITGGCGFIGSNFIEHILKHNYDVEIVNVDKHTSVANDDLMNSYANDIRYLEVVQDLNEDGWQEVATLQKNPDIVIHFAAESHVDRSCEDVEPFVNSNISGTIKVTNFCATRDIPMVYISTDEVYGELGEFNLPFTEDTPLNPRNPYSATKASGEFLVGAIANTHNWKRYAITRCSNNFGPLQDKTKFIPVCIKSILDGKQIPLYGEGLQIRDWIHVIDHCTGIECIANALLNANEIIPNIYNIGGNNEKSNLGLATIICNIMDVNPNKTLKFIEDPRGNAHDFRYAIDSSLLQSTLHWHPKHSDVLEESLPAVIDWYKANPDFLT